MLRPMRNLMSGEIDITVVLCTANRDTEGLFKTLKSLHQSTYKNFQVLLINDSSYPLPIDLPINDLRTTIVEIGENLGLTAALKRVESLIFTRLIARVDCGDYVSPKRLEKQHEFLSLNPNVVLVGARTALYIQEGSQIKFSGVSPASDEIDDLSSFLLWRNPFVHGSIMFRTAAFLAVGGYDSSFRIAQDFNLYMRIRKKGELYILPEVLCEHVFNLRSSNTIQKNKASAISSLRSRITLAAWYEWLHSRLVVAVLRDLIVFFIPGYLLIWLRFARITKKHHSSDRT